VRFDPAVGYEIQKTRPALIIQNDVSNQFSPITIVAAISSQFSTPPFPSRLRKKAGNRLLTRAAQKRSHVFAGTYRAATVTELKAFSAAC